MDLFWLSRRGERGAVAQSSRVRFDLIGNNINPTLFIDKPQVPSNPFSATPMFLFMTARDPNTRPDFTQMYNLSVQRQLGGNVVVEVGLGQSHRILIDDPINNAVPALPNDTSSVQSRRRVNEPAGRVQLPCPKAFPTTTRLSTLKSASPRG